MLQQRAASKAAWQSAARRAALGWLRSPATEAAAKAVADWQNVLQVGRVPQNNSSVLASARRGREVIFIDWAHQSTPVRWITSLLTEEKDSGS